MQYLVVFKKKYCDCGTEEEEIVINADNFFSAIEVAKIAWMNDDNRVCILAIRQKKY